MPEIDQEELHYEKLQEVAEKVTADLHAAGMTGLIVVTDRFVSAAEELRKQHSKLTNGVVSSLTRETEAPKVDLGTEYYEMASGFESQPRPDQLHLCRDTPQDVVNAKVRAGKLRK